MPFTSPGNGKTTNWIPLLSFILGPVLGMVSGFFAVKATAEATYEKLNQQVIKNASDIAEQKKDVEYFRNNYVLYREFKLQLDVQTETLSKIESSINQIRYRRN